MDIELFFANSLPVKITRELLTQYHSTYGMRKKAAAVEVLARRFLKEQIFSSYPLPMLKLRTWESKIELNTIYCTLECFFFVKACL